MLAFARLNFVASYIAFLPLVHSVVITQCPTVETQLQGANGTVFMACPNTDYQGPDKSIVWNVTDVNSCAQICSQSAGCLHSVWDQEYGWCHLKDESAPLTWSSSDRFSSTRLASLSSCPTTEISVNGANGELYLTCPNTDYRGPDVSVTKDVDTLAQCALLCSQTAGCINSVWDQEYKWCHIKGPRQNLTWYPDTRWGSTRLVGLSSCPTTETRVVGTDGKSFLACSNSDYQGPDAAVVGNIANVDDCVNQCSRTDGCQHAVWDTQFGWCHLKGPSDSLTWYPNEAFQSARLTTIESCQSGETQIITQNGNTFMICPNTDYEGWSTRVINPIYDIGECAELCSTIQGCTNAVHDKSQSCHIKTDRADLNWSPSQQFNSLRLVSSSAITTGYRLIGSSGAAAQMVFLPPNTTKCVFIDNYHINTGGPGYNMYGNINGEFWTYPGSDINVFGTELDWRTTQLRAVEPKSNTFCSAGAFWPDGTLANLAGAEPDGIENGFQAIRTYAPGPCLDNVCTQNWIEWDRQLQVARWYPTAHTMTDGGTIVIGGSNAGGLVYNLAEINVPTYEKVYADGRATGPPVNLPILTFPQADNQNPRKSYNLYPAVHLLPNSKGLNLFFQQAATFAEVWDYDQDEQHKGLPGTPNDQPRSFPSSATFALLPVRLDDQVGEVLMCGGSSADKPNPLTLNDCWRIRPLDSGADWIADDDLPNGGQVMSDGVLLPDGTVLILNGAHKGCAGGFMADDPVLTPLLYNPLAPKGSRFSNLPATDIPRLYHSVAHLLPTGEVLVAGSNPTVNWGPNGDPPPNPQFWNYNGQAYLLQQQDQSSRYPTDYRVQIFAPPYMNSPTRPVLTLKDITAVPGGTFAAALNFNGMPSGGKLLAFLSNPGFSTHGQHMGQRMIELEISNTDGDMLLTAPPNYSFTPPGFYLVFVSVNGIPAEGQWLQIL